MTDDPVPRKWWQTIFELGSGRPAVFDAFRVLVHEKSTTNLKDFELLAGTESPTGRFRSIGRFQTQNLVLIRDPFQEFGFPRVQARYLKVKVLSTWGHSYAWVNEFQLLGVLDE